MSLRDAQGNAASTASHEALAFAEKALWRMMSFYGTPADELDAAIAADPAWLLPRVMKAGFLLGLTEPSLAAEARRELDAAEARLGQASERERAHHGALRTLAGGDWGGACARWQALLDAHPRDLLALQWSHLFDFYRGDAEGLRERVGGVLPHWPQDDPLLPYVLGLHAFGLEESHRYAEAEAVGRQAIAADPRVPWAIHAVGHVMEMQGRHDEGLRWMSASRPQWAEGNGFAGHLGWHHALFALETLDRDAALALFDAHLSPQAVEITLQRIDAASLLWRCALLGMEVGGRWRDLLAAWPLDEREAGFSAFNDMHAVLALTGAGELGRATAYAEAAIAHAGHAASSNREVMRRVGAPLLRGLIAFGHGRFDAATLLIAPLRASASRIGGSHAQRDVIEQTLLAAAARGSDKSVGRHLVEERRRAKPGTALTEHWAGRFGVA